MHMQHSNQPDDNPALVVDHVQPIGAFEARDFACSLEGAAAIVRSVHDANAHTPGRSIAIDSPDGTMLALLRGELVWFTVPINLVPINVDVDVEDEGERHGRTV